MDAEANPPPNPPMQQHQPPTTNPAPRRRSGRTGCWTRTGVFILVLMVTVLLVRLVVVIGQAIQASQETPPIVANHWCLASNAQFSSQMAHVSSSSQIVAITLSNLWVLGTNDTGDYTKNTERQTPLFEHWDGKNWSTIPGADTSALVNNLSSQMPGPRNIYIHINQLAALSANNIWAVGGVSINATNKPHGLEHTLIEHWDGNRWSLVPSPDGAGSVFVNELKGISAVSANDIWAVGMASTGDQFTALIEHWDGHHWNWLQSSYELNGTYLTNVAALSQDDIWLFGSTLPLMYTTSPPRPLIAHWGGSTWEQTDPGADGVAISSVSALSSDNIWAVTQRIYKPNTPDPAAQTDDSSTRTNLIHWDGKYWEPMDAPGALGNGGNLSVIAANRPDDIWLVGINTQSVPFIEHWDGENWHKVQQNFSPLISVSMVTIKDGKIWLVGNGPESSGGTYNWSILDNC